MLRRFQAFMYGRYGGRDQFNIFLIILSFILSLLLRKGMLVIISWIPLTYAIVRMFSKNISKRYAENQAFMKIWSKITGGFSKLSARIKNGKYYKFYKCPACSKKLRVPKGKGKISISCPVCKTRFIKKT